MLLLPGKAKAKTMRRGSLCTKAEAGLGDVLAPGNPQEAFLTAFTETDSPSKALGIHCSSWMLSLVKHQGAA